VRLGGSEEVAVNSNLYMVDDHGAIWTVRDRHDYDKGRFSFSDRSWDQLQQQRFAGFSIGMAK